MPMTFDSFESAIQTLGTTIYGKELKGSIRYATSYNHVMLAEASLKIDAIRKKIEKLERGDRDGGD